VFSIRRIAIILSLTVFAFRLDAQTNAATPKASPSKPAAAVSSDAKPGSVETRVEQYLRQLYAWGPSFEVKVGPSRPSPVHELLEVPVTVTMQGQSDNAIVYVSKDGNFIIRGELADMSKNPLADIRSKLNPGDSPSIGPENAKITLIEFADFECPSCRQLDLILRNLLTTHPEVRLVYKNFPLTDIHPWAMTAALAAQCTYKQNPAAFWKIHDAIFDAQDLITPSNVWDKLMDLGAQQGLNMDQYRACIADHATTNQVEQAIGEGRALNITATPTIFVNGRRVVGPDQTLVEQFIQYETSKY
jgi:protein-disulfide isomerase